MEYCTTGEDYSVVLIRFPEWLMRWLTSSVICVVNIVLTIMIVRAGSGVKNIAAQ